MGVKKVVNDFGYIPLASTLLHEKGSHLLVGVEGDAAREPYYREGNGLNIGLYGPKDFVQLLQHYRADPLNVSTSLRWRQQLGGAMTEEVVYSALESSAVEVLLDDNGVDA